MKRAICILLSLPGLYAQAPASTGQTADLNDLIQQVVVRVVAYGERGRLCTAQKIGAENQLRALHLSIVDEDNKLAALRAQLVALSSQRPRSPADVDRWTSDKKALEKRISDESAASKVRKALLSTQGQESIVTRDKAASCVQEVEAGLKQLAVGSSHPKAPSGSKK